MDKNAAVLVLFDNGDYMNFTTSTDFYNWYNSRTADERKEFTAFGKLTYLGDDGCPFCNS